MKNNPLKSDDYIQQLCIAGTNAHKKKKMEIKSVVSNES